MYLERLNVFDYENNFHFKHDGVINVHSKYAKIQMPNCTLGAYCRAHEAIEATAKVKGIARANSTGFGNAKNWFAETGMPKGSEPREGSIVVFDGNCGHVAFVERVLDKATGKCLITQSSYNDNKDLRDWQFWSKREWELRVGETTVAGCGKVLGFIYLPINDIRTTRNAAKNQVEIIATYVNVRKEPSTSAPLFCKGLYCPVGIYNVIEFAEADGYTWAKLDEECWVACDESWSVIYHKEKSKDLQEQINELKEENAKLAATNEKLNKKLAADENVLTQVKEEVEKLNKILK